MIHLQNKFFYTTFASTDSSKKGSLFANHPPRSDIECEWLSIVAGDLFLTAASGFVI